MMTSLFSSFDPMSSILSLNYLILLAPSVIILSTNISLSPSRMQNILKMMNNFISKEVTTIISNTNNKSKTLILWSIFMVLLVMNLMSLLPYVFTMSAHMAFTLSLAFPFWLSFMLFSMLKNTNHFLSHLVPLSTPIFLSQFMTVIETVSQIIRPITLSVRLAANMTAGHILMALASAPITTVNHYSLVLMTLLLLELAVAFIQSYVFTILLTMYLAESN